MAFRLFRYCTVVLFCDFVVGLAALLTALCSFMFEHVAFRLITRLAVQRYMHGGHLMLRLFLFFVAAATVVILAFCMFTLSSFCLLKMLSASCISLHDLLCLCKCSGIVRVVCAVGAALLF